MASEIALCILELPVTTLEDIKAIYTDLSTKSQTELRKLEALTDFPK
ncbi:hypothetical protein J4N42_05315 [Vibrio sp. SCSIO 43135]|nr:hypothetical protein [Vibrio sp. SCSIO 43135]USD42141.1 hypothetical protein J4N42_05315 [Vibrio sp. SCSIO 43135]